MFKSYNQIVYYNVIMDTNGNISEQHTSRLRKWLPLVVAVAFVLGMGLEWLLTAPFASTPGQKKLAELYDIIEENYVDEVDIDSLIELSIASMLNSLDPHSVYLPASEREKADSELEGSFSGVGIQFRIEDDTIQVIEVISGGPAEKVGLMAGDKIIEIDGADMAGTGVKNDDVFNLLRGENGSKVEVTIKRPAVKDNLKFDITRGNVPVTSIDAAFTIEDGVGYIKINKFSRNTYQEFLQKLAELSSAGAEDFILDLRGNVGGYMEPAVMIVNEFLSRGQVIVSTKGRIPANDDIILSDGHGILGEARLVVLIDELSASASEILSGAIQDNDRGLIIGRRSFGKGLVQQPIELSDGSEIRLTVQRYYTPSGRSIQKSYKPGQNEEYEEEIYDRYRSGELLSLDSTKINRDLLFRTLSGREVYGGGGIIPDIFVPNDTSAVTSYYINVANRGLLQKFAYEYVNLNRASLSKSKNVTDLLRQLPNDEILLGSFVDFARMNGVAPRWYYINISRTLIVIQLKALIARDVLGISAYYEVYSGIDNNIREALKALHDGKADYPIKPGKTK